MQPWWGELTLQPHALVSVWVHQSLLCSSFPDSSKSEEEKWQLYFHFLIVILKLLSYVHLSLRHDVWIIFFISLFYIFIFMHIHIQTFPPLFFFNLSCYLPIWFSGRLCGQHTFLYCLKNGVPLFLLNSKRVTRISDVYIIVLLFVGAINASNAALKMFSHLRREHLESGRIADLLWAAALVRFSILCCFNSAEMVRKGAEKPDRVLLTCGCSVSVWVSEYLVCLQTNAQKNTGRYIHWQRMG